MVEQKEMTLPLFERGFHLITRYVLKELGELPEMGLLNVYIKHTSAGLSINENADPTVRQDFEKIFNHLVPENQPYYRHTIEGPDDMPAHAKAAMTGSSITVPISRGRLNLGAWQGLYLCEFRNRGGKRKLVLTIYS